MSDQTLHLGDALTLLPELCPNPAVILTDPPYGTGRNGYSRGGMGHTGPDETYAIVGDLDTTVRDRLLALYPTTPAAVFGSIHRPPPAGTVQTLVMRKAPDAGYAAARAGYARDLEAVHLVGPWPRGAPRRSSLLTTTARSQGNPWGVAARHGHPHAKPLDILCALLEASPPGLILDPFAGSGTTLLACRLLNRDAIGIEIDPRWHRVAQANLAQQVLT